VALLEERITEFLKNLNEPIPQFELAKRLNVDSRLISRALARLEKKGIIKRRKTTIRGKHTFLIYPLSLYYLSKSPEIPCFYCSHLEVCGKDSNYDPSKCEKLFKWLIEISKELD